MEELVSSNHQWHSKNQYQEKEVGVLGLDPITKLVAQMTTISKKLGKLDVNSIQIDVVCDYCTENRASVDCQVGEFLYSTKF